MELKPCPFCGGEAHIASDYNTQRDETRWSIWHECEGHKGRSRGYAYELYPWFETPWYDTESAAVEAWNTRSERTCYRVSDYIPASGYDDEIYWDDECSECHERGIEKSHNYCPNCGAKVVEE